MELPLRWCGPSRVSIRTNHISYVTKNRDRTSSTTLRPSRRGLVVALAALPLGAGVISVSRSSDLTLVVADADSAERLVEHPVDDGETVVLAYTHSVERTPVRDVYEVDDGALRMVRTEFSSFGAGLPTDDVERTDDGYVVHLDDRHERLRVAPRAVAGHELVVGGTRYDLVALAEDRLAISVASGRGASFDRIATDPDAPGSASDTAGAIGNGVSRRS